MLGEGAKNFNFILEPIPLNFIFSC